MKYTAHYKIVLRNKEEDRALGIDFQVDFSTNAIPRIGEKMLRPGITAGGALFWEASGSQVSPARVVDVSHHGETFSGFSDGAPLPLPKVLEATVEVLIDDGKTFPSLIEATAYMFALVNLLQRDNRYRVGSFAPLPSCVEL